MQANAHGWSEVAAACQIMSLLSAAGGQSLVLPFLQRFGLTEKEVGLEFFGAVCSGTVGNDGLR